MTPDPLPTLHLITGSKLTNISFEMDYITFVFGDLVLAALSHPIVYAEGTLIESRQAHFRDALLSLVRKTVASTAELPARLEVHFDSGHKFIIPLDAPFPRGPEMATLSGHGTFLASWLRPDRRKYGQS